MCEKPKKEKKAWQSKKKFPKNFHFKDNPEMDLNCAVVRRNDA